MKVTVRRLWYLLFCAIHRSGEKRGKFLQRRNWFQTVGKGFFFQPFLLPAETEMIRFHDNVVVAANVRFINHDATYRMLGRIDNSRFTIYRGCIEVMNNVFIGSYSTVLPNVRIGANCIVAAGSLVNKDVPSGCIVGGVPARVIGEFDEFYEKRMQYTHHASPLPYEKRIDSEWVLFYRHRNGSDPLVRNEPEDETPSE